MVFELLNYNIIVVKFYKEKDKEYLKLLDCLDYYMLDIKDKKSYLFYFTLDKNELFIVWNKKTTIWDNGNLTTVISDIIKKSLFNIIHVNSISGKMMSNFWDSFEEAREYYNNTKKYRKNIKKIENSELVSKESKEQTIDDILNKINKNGIENLSKDDINILNSKINKNED